MLAPVVLAAGSFCHAYDYIGACQYMIANQQQSCCPTSTTTTNY
jgi:hypothetical protein